MWGSIISAGASLLGGAMQASAARKAANQVAAANAAAGQKWDQFSSDTAAAYSPYTTAGTDALAQWQSGINTPTSAADVMQDPGYQFGLDQGQQAIARQGAAAGGRVSGAALKAATQYANNYATQGYNAAYQRGQNRLAQLAAMAGTGLSAQGAVTGARQSGLNAITGLLTDTGSTRAGATMAQGNIWGNTGNSIAALLARQQQTPTASVYGDMSRQSLGLG